MPGDMPDDAGCTEQVSRQETPMRGQSPLVSVIMRSHNDGEYVDEAIKSVLTQTYQHLEVVIVNDGSTDSTFDRVEYWRRTDARVRPIHNKPNRGGPASANIALGAALGEYVANLDADNYWVDRQKLAQQVCFLEAQADHVLVGGLTQKVNRTGQPLGIIRRPETDEEIRRQFLRRNPIGASAVCFRRQAALSVGGYPQHLRFSEDYGLWLALGQLGKVHNLQRIWNAYRVTGDNINDLQPAAQLVDQMHYVRKYRRAYPGYRRAVLACTSRRMRLRLAKWASPHPTAAAGIHALKSWKSAWGSSK
jgi:glycosyltransferase involved in cell wall biosynthesis